MLFRSRVGGRGGVAGHREIDVAELAARAPGLAVQVDAGRGLEGQGAGEPVGRRRGLAAEQVDHDRGAGRRRAREFL